MTSKKRFAQSAEIKKDLIFYDGPQLVMLRSDRGHFMFAVGVDHQDFGYAMFASEIHDKLLQDYMNGKVDLQFAFYASKFRTKYFFDYEAQTHGSVKLARALESETENTSFYPDHGIFSRMHENPFANENFVSRNIRFFIDGAWESEDFSRFHGKLADIYSTTYIAWRTSSSDGLSASELDFISKSIQEKDWRGGGSYLGFYATVKGEARSAHPLRVAGISYNSPGHIDLMGESHIMTERYL